MTTHAVQVLPPTMDLETLVRDLAPRLLAYCRSRSSLDDLAEEVAQDALTALVERVRHKRPVESPEAFVFTIARRRMARRHVRRRLWAPLESLLGRPQEAAAVDNPEIRTTQRLYLARVRAALEQISSRDREALLLVAVGEVDTATGATVLGIGRSAFKMRVHRARRRLAELLEDDTAAVATPLEEVLDA